MTFEDMKYVQTWPRTRRKGHAKRTSSATEDRSTRRIALRAADQQRAILTARVSDATAEAGHSYTGSGCSNSNGGDSNLLQGMATVDAEMDEAAWRAEERRRHVDGIEAMLTMVMEIIRSEVAEVIMASAVLVKESGPNALLLRVTPSPARGHGVRRKLA